MIAQAAPSRRYDPPCAETDTPARAPDARVIDPEPAAATANAPPYCPDGAATLREELIRTAAYFRAERRGFASGNELADWLEAEREIDRWIETRGAPHRYRAPPRD